MSVESKRKKRMYVRGLDCGRDQKTTATRIARYIYKQANARYVFEKGGAIR